jgi:hypothetical protein
LIGQDLGSKKGRSIQFDAPLSGGVATLATSSPFKAGADESAPEGCIFNIFLASVKWFITPEIPDSSGVKQSLSCQPFS